MLDPLRSLAELVRTLTRSRPEARGSAETQRQKSADVQAISDRPPTAISAADALRERLRHKLRAIGNGDRRRAREAFVETVLASELGDAVTLDPSMAEIVSKVARELGSDSATERDLNLLFDDLARDAR